MLEDSRAGIVGEAFSAIAEPFSTTLFAAFAKVYGWFTAMNPKIPTHKGAVQAKSISRRMKSWRCQ
jgi:hypothetical protein